jgi:hypothetical protein
MAEHVMEIVRFGVATGASRAEVASAGAALESWLRSQPGFVARRLCREADGNWIDIVEWSDLASAKTAADAIMSTPAAARFMALIDPKSVEMSHASIELSQ